MAQAPFDSTCDIYSGPLALPPNMLLAAGVPCRVVIQSEVFIVSSGAPPRFAYVTVAPPTIPPALWYTLFGPMAGQYYQLAFPSGSPTLHVVLFEEAINPHGRPVYHRYHLGA